MLKARVFLGWLFSLDTGHRAATSR
uniref:Uncharacterized protein n=1 Tax=Anguilla anguilla TaxID=7936 RepID=A0A0E9VHM6_ANGAN